jgi:transcriptional regulator with XRE-family HTH domain
MDAAVVLRRARVKGPYTLRELAARAGTSHATIAAYESGRKVPTVTTLDRILRAAGVELGEELTPALGGPDAGARGRELMDALDLAAMFPARHEPELTFPRFGPAPLVGPA